MMTVLTSPADLALLPQPVVFAIGVFDGVHLGHRSVIAAALHRAQDCGGTAVVMTFEPHPQRVLRPESAPQMLTGALHMERLVASLGVQVALRHPFDARVAALEPQAFIEGLASACGRLDSIFVGDSWRFGRKRAGDVPMLCAMGQQLGFQVFGMTPIMLGDEVVSSTLVRAAVECGDLQRAARLLGRPYSLMGIVIHGRQLARQLGCPTANLDVAGLLLPPTGVYVAQAHVCGEWRSAVVNLGLRPTVAGDSAAPALEAHLLDFSADLYGQAIDVRLAQFLRPEQRFPSLDALRAQIAQDIATTRTIATAHASLRSDAHAS